LFTDPEEIGVMERLLNRVVLTLLSIGVGLVSVLLLGTAGGPILTTIGVSLYEVLGWIGLSIAVVLLLRVLLAVLRNERDSIG
jgi:ubiquinone biosynthesis protein